MVSNELGILSGANSTVKLMVIYLILEFNSTVDLKTYPNTYFYNQYMDIFCKHINTTNYYSIAIKLQLLF